MVDDIDFYPPWRSLYEKYKDIPYGTFISFDELSNVSQITLYGHGWTFAIERFKKEMLIASNRAVINIRKKGYRIVNANEHPNLIIRESRRAQRRIKHGVDLSIHVDYDMLTDVEKKQMDDIAIRMMTINSFMIRGTKRIKKLSMEFDIPDVPRLPVKT